jgi:hypothetical protein
LEVTMPRTRKHEAPLLVDAPVVQGRYAELDDDTVPPDLTAMSAMSAMGADERTARDLADRLVSFLETGGAPDGLFTTDVFCDFTMPQWRLQAQGIDDVVAMRLAGHPQPGRIPRSRFDATTTGFVLEVEEQWEQDGESWYCRELFRADVADGAISQISVYCTGDWDPARVARHAATVHLIRR